jgi:acyl carrier protein phosphodiesterase
VSIELLERVGSLKIYHSPNQFIALQDIISKDTFVVLYKEIEAVRDLLTSFLSKNNIKLKPDSPIEAERLTHIIQQEVN